MAERGEIFRLRLRRLLEVLRNSAGQPYSYRELAGRIRDRGFEGPSAAYLQQLATGYRRDPKLSHLEAIADALGVPASYFFDDGIAQRLDQQLDVLESEQQRAREGNGEDARLMALRAGQLSEQGRRQVMDVLDLVYRLEHPPDRPS